MLRHVKTSAVTIHRNNMKINAGIMRSQALSTHALKYLNKDSKMGTTYIFFSKFGFYGKY